MVLWVRHLVEGGAVAIVLDREPGVVVENTLLETVAEPAIPRDFSCYCFMCLLDTTYVEIC